MATRDDREPMADEAIDAAFQAGYDAGADGFKLIESALSVLVAEIDPGPAGSLEHRAIQDARVQAAGRIARLMRADVEPS